MNNNLPALPIVMKLQSGQIIDYLDPTKTKVIPSDIRRNLANQRRYAGGLDETVLQHLALCVLYARMRYLDKDGNPDAPTAAYAAAHDLHEYVVQDIPKPLKMHLPEYEAIERIWEEYVHLRIGLQWPVPPAILKRVRTIDARVCAIEAHAFGAADVQHYLDRHGGPLQPREIDLGISARDTREPALWRWVAQAIVGVSKNEDWIDEAYHTASSGFAP